MYGNARFPQSPVFEILNKCMRAAARKTILQDFCNPHVRTYSRTQLGHTKSRLTYALPVWGPVVHQDSLLRLNRLHNRAVCITCGLRKSDHISSHRQSIGWLPVSLLIQRRTLCAMMDQYTGRGTIQPPFTIWTAAYS